ncbi:MAG: HAMP domain-containing histidine kinase [Planctomycetes bacterium]|nr:HAMP domain-containing histidine kinase [Planctomycetota bacterium]
MDSLSTPPELESMHRVCHELRRPLTVIHAYSELLADGIAGPLNEDQQKHMDTVLGAAEGLGNQIQALVGLAEIDSGHFHLIEEDVDLSGVCPERLKRFADRFTAAGIELEFDNQSDELLAETDLERLQACVTEFLDNALKYTPRGGKVRVTQLTTDDEFRIGVWSSGPGVQADECERLFERYYRADMGSEGLDAKGLGIGLTLCRANAKALGGRAWAEPAREGGMNFYLDFPIWGQPSIYSAR